MTNNRTTPVIMLLVLLTVLAPASPAISAPTKKTQSAPVQNIWVDPVRGSDSASGTARSSALKTLNAAWGRIPQSQPLARPVRILVRRGVVRATDAPNYWEHRWGSAQAPITIVSADGPGRAQLPSINMFDVRYLTLNGVTIRSQFDTFHCEKCTNISLMRSAFVGVGNPAQDQGPHETIKINQSADIRIEDSYVAGATDNAIDLVAVNRARILRNKISQARDWCAYAKGGSSDIVFDSNIVSNCGTGGITIGQGTGLEFMVAPWLQYEAYGAVVTNNVIHDVEGAALGVNGGYAVLMAFNTAYRVGTRDHLLEVVFGERSCDGDAGACAARRALGAWGPAAPGGDPTPIGNRHISLMHNLIYNPPGVRSQWTHFTVYAPRDVDGGAGPNPSHADKDLTIRGNVLWNGPTDLELGLGGDQGCADDHPTCSPATVRAENNINATTPSIRILAGATPVPIGSVSGGLGAAASLPSFPWNDLPSGLTVPAVSMPVKVEKDRAQAIRSAHPWRAGAYSTNVPLTTLRVSGLNSRGRILMRGGGAISGKGGSRTLLRGDWVELNARPARGMRFAGWGGACARVTGNVCVVRASGPKLAVNARFQRRI